MPTKRVLPNNFALGLVQALAWLSLGSLESVSAFQSSKINRFSCTNALRPVPQQFFLADQLSSGKQKQHSHLKMTSLIDDNIAADPAKAKEIEEDVPKTLSKAIQVFFFSKHSLGPSLVSLVLLSLLSWRLVALGPITAFDIISCTISIIFWMLQEHMLHGKGLHSEFDWYGKMIHQQHHEKPYFHISIDPPALMFIWLATAHAIFRFVLPLPVAVSATLGYATAGLFYEWAHYIVHTKVKPKSAFMKKMRDNHIRHHCVDSNFWLAFSLPLIDDLFGTNPDVQAIQRKKRSERSKVAAQQKSSTG